MQDLSLFRVPADFRGRSALVVQLWWLVSRTLFRLSPQALYGWRRFLLRLFGAEIGKSVIIRPSATITYPWKLKIGDYSWVGDDTVLYTLGEIEIGRNSVVSQQSYLSAADHDYMRTDFPLRAKKIIVGHGVWIATRVFVAPGVTIGDGSVVGACSSVFKDLPSGMICFGSPAKAIKPRTESVPPPR